MALTGTGMTTVALALLAFQLSGGNAGAVLGSVMAVRLIAYVGLAPAIGGIAHRLPRKKLLVWLDVARAAMVLTLPLVDGIWPLFAVVILVNICSAAFSPIFQATIPDVLPDEARYTRALSLTRLAFDLEKMLSPTVAALALAFWSFDVLFVANAFGFLISALLLLSAAIPAPKPTDRPGGLLQNVTFGVRAYLATPRLRGLLALSMTVAASGTMIIVNTVVYVKSTLGLGDLQTSAVLIAAGCGSMTVALALPRILDRLPDRPVMLCGAVVLVAGLTAGTTGPTYAWLFPLWFLLGAGASLVQTPAARLVRRSCGAGDRTALFAAHFALSHVAWLVGYLFSGWVGARLGMTTAFAVLAAVAAVSAVVAFLVWPPGDPAEMKHQHPAHHHAHPHMHDEHHQHDHEGWEGPEPHVHDHDHGAVTHRHPFVIDLHHPRWPG